MNSKVTIRIRKTRQSGVEWSIAHILRPKIERPGGNEFHVEERLACYFGNLPFPVNRSDKYSVSTQLETAARLSRSRERVKMVIISFQDSIDPLVREKQVALMPALVTAFVNRYAPAATYWVGVHIDRNHVHAHVALANWSPTLGTSLNWTRRDLVSMLSLRWVQSDPALAVAVRPGAWSKAGKATMAYPRSEACRSLVEKLRSDPATGFASLERTGELSRYRTVSGHPGVIYCGKKISLKNLNYELGKIGSSVGVGEDYSPIPLPSFEIDELTQQNRLDQAIGIENLTLPEYDGLCDLPDPAFICRWPEEREALERFRRTGRVTDQRQASVLKRLCRTALIRRAKGATAPLGKNDDFCRWVYGDMTALTSEMRRFIEELATTMTDIGGELGRAVMLVIAMLLTTGKSIEMDIE